MTDLARDPVHNAIQNGIKEDIRVTFEHERIRAGLMLIYAGMDAMATLDMPDGQTDVRANDFISWADRYIRFPCKEQVTGADFYGARCAFLHNYSAASRLSRQGKCRLIGYMDKSVPEVRYNATVDPRLVLVCVQAFKDAFFRAIDNFLVFAFSDSAKAKVVEARLENLILVFPVKRSLTNPSE